MTESELRSVLGANLKRYRCLKGLSQAKLAEMVDISPNFISDVETGKRWISSDTMVNLAAALNIEVFEFFKLEKPPPDDVAESITRFANEAAATINSLVNQSLENLRKKYLS
ncbi:MAG: helix-turn-helix domain-containing protein [Spirochaetaceae bacterium]|jgi:transcriptional regulator with XRE-family HTH domain|nr:helix-turn-helix domain-containing protein [Spirochaetaceae bacterium]